MFISTAAAWSAGDRFAVVVGIDAYDLLSSLKAGVNDAEKIASYYQGLGFKVWLMTDRQPSRMDQPSLANFNRVLDNVSQLAKGQGVEELVFFFAGHGVQIQNANYLCFPEAVVTGDTGMLNVDKVIVPWLKDVNAKLSMVYLDACRNDLGPVRAGGVTRGLTVVPAADSENAAAKGEIAIFYAAKPGAFSFEKPDGTNGFFTDTLVEALQSKSVGTISDLYSYIRAALPERTEKAYGKPQIPNIGGDFDLTTRFSRGEVDLASFDTTGRLFVESSSPGATIKINGAVRGTTPMLIEKIVPGSVLVEVESGDSYGSQQLTVQPRTAQNVRLEMSKISSNLFVRSLKTFDPSTGRTEDVGDAGGFLQEMTAYADGREIAVFSTTFLPGFPPGQKEVEIMGKGWAWRGNVTFKPREDAKVDVVMRPIGDLRFTVPSGTEILLTSKTYGEELRPPVPGGVGEEEVYVGAIYAGEWAITLKKEGFETLTEAITVPKREILYYEPQFKPLRSTALKVRLSEARSLLERDKKTRAKLDAAGLVSAGLGLALGAVSGYFIYDSYNKYQGYLLADSAEGARSARTGATLSFNLGLGSGIGSALGLAIGLPSLIGGPHTITSYNKEIRGIEAELKTLEGTN
jgi:hypothetical protein